MALKIVDRPSFTTTVVVNLAWLQGDFQARFVALPIDQLEAMERAGIAAGKGPQAILHDVCTWFADVELPSGLLQYVDGKSLTTLLNYQGIGPAMVRAYYSALWEEARGN